MDVVAKFAQVTAHRRTRCFTKWRKLMTPMPTTSWNVEYVEEGWKWAHFCILVSAQALSDTFMKIASSFGCREPERKLVNCATTALSSLQSMHQILLLDCPQPFFFWVFSEFSGSISSSSFAWFVIEVAHVETRNLPVIFRALSYSFGSFACQ